VLSIFISHFKQESQVKNNTSLAIEIIYLYLIIAKPIVDYFSKIINFSLVEFLSKNYIVYDANKLNNPVSTKCCKYPV
jgi:hypothetical protein